MSSVPFVNVLYDKWIEIPVNLPKAEFGTVLPVYVELEGRPFNMGGGAGCGGRSTEKSLEAHTNKTSSKKIRKNTKIR